MKLVLKENAFAGDKIQKERIPSVYVRKCGIHNLFGMGIQKATVPAIRVLTMGPASWWLFWTC